jgi:hypothetical protein
VEKKKFKTYLDGQLPMHPKRRVLESLGDGHIRVLEICIFADQSDGHFVEETFLAMKEKVN